jgi:hypothetical protein
MTALHWIQNHGVRVSLEDMEHVRLEGLDRLNRVHAEEVIQFARENKSVLLDALRGSLAKEWRSVGLAEHPNSGERGRLVQHSSGRYALDVGRSLLTVDQEWAEAEAAKWVQ